LEKKENWETFIAGLFKMLVKKGKLSIKDKVLFLASDMKSGSETNFLEICDVGKYLGK
jgi:hypothetical protein